MFSVLQILNWELNSLHLQQCKQLSVNVKPREKQNNISEQVLRTLSGTKSENKMEFVFWLSAQRRLI